MDEIKLGQHQAKGAHAEELLRSEILNDTFAHLEREYLRAWQVTTTRDTEARERLWQAVNILGLVKQHLAKLVNDGKLASRDLASIKYLKR